MSPSLDSTPLDIVFSPTYFKKLFGPDLSCLGILGNAIKKSSPTLIGHQSKPITPQMSRVIVEILHCKFHGMFKKTYLEAKVIELLNLQIDQFNNDYKPSLSNFKLSQEDVDKLYYIKELIHKSPGADYSLMQLAKIAGFNDFKLKKGFKQLFGNTVFGYITNMRMQRSYELLQEGKHSITHIAYLMGYKYPHHFTKAFKMKFGFTPKNLKK